MKKLLLLTLLVSVAIISKAQFAGNITVVNNTPCDLYVGLFGIDAGGNPCMLNYGAVPFIATANSSNTYDVNTVPNGWSYGSTLPPSLKMLWTAARVYDPTFPCTVPLYPICSETVGDPACYPTFLNGAPSSCGSYSSTWDPSIQTLTINP